MTDGHRFAYDRAVATGDTAATQDVAPARSEGPLSRADLDLLARAHAQLASIRRAGTVAALNGWTLAGCAALCMPLTLADPMLLLVGAGLGYAAWAELRGRRMLRALDPRAPGRLALNQLATFLVVLAYCVWRVHVGLSGPRPSETPEIAELLGRVEGTGLADTIDHIYPIALAMFYGAVIGVCALYQGACAVHYLARRKPLQRYLAETPAWVRDVQRALGAS